MGKNKHPKNQRKSARGHDQDAEVRYRRKWYYKDEEIPPPPPPKKEIKAKRKAMAQAMLSYTGKETTGVEESLQCEPEVPDNVVSLCERRAANEEPQSPPSQSVKDSINYDRSLYRMWHNMNKKRYVPEKEASAWEWRRLLEYSAAHPKGRNEHPNTESDTNKKPVSMVHNPGLSANPIEPEKESGGYNVVSYNSKAKARPIVVHNRMNREGQYILYDPRIHAPSGLPIKEFTEGKYKPKPKAEHKSTEVRPAVTPRAWAVEDQLFTMIDMVPEECWPMDHLKPFLFKDDETGKWHVHTGKVREAISKQEDRVINRAVTLAFIQHDSDRQEYVKHLEEEIESLQAERKQLEFLVSTHAGEQVTAEDIPTHDWTPNGARQSARAIAQGYATQYAKPPTIDKLVAEFKLFNSFVQFNGANHAFARMHYGDPTLADKVEAECQRRMQVRADAADAERTAKLEKLRLRIFLKEIPTLIKLQPEHDFLAGLSQRHSKVAREQYAMRQMHKRNHKAVPKQKAYLSGLVVSFNRHDFKVLLNGRPVMQDHVDVHCSDFRYVREPEISARLINKSNSVQHWQRNNPKLVPSMVYWRMKFEPIEPTVLVTSQMEDGELETYADQYECYSKRAASTIKRWERRLDSCYEHADQVIATRKAEAERQRYLVAREKPLNKTVDGIIKLGRKLKQIGDKDVFVTPWEQKRRDKRAAEAEALRLKSEQEAQEAAERKERIRIRRAEVKARKKAEKQRNQELLAQKEAEKRNKQLAKKLYGQLH